MEAGVGSIEPVSNAKVEISTPKKMHLDIIEAVNEADQAKVKEWLEDVNGVYITGLPADVCSIRNAVEITNPQETTMGMKTVYVKVKLVLDGDVVHIIARPGDVNQKGDKND